MDTSEAAYFSQKFETASNVFGKLPEGARLVSVKFRGRGWGASALLEFVGEIRPVNDRCASPGLSGRACLLRRDSEEVLYVEHESGPEIILWVTAISRVATLVQFVTGKSLPQLVFFLWTLAGRGRKSIELRFFDEKGKFVSRKITDAEIRWLDKLKSDLQAHITLFLRRTSTGRGTKSVRAAGTTKEPKQ